MMAAAFLGCIMARFNIVSYKAGSSVGNLEITPCTGFCFEAVMGYKADAIQNPSEASKICGTVKCLP